MRSLLALVCLAVASAQQPAFEVASIKLSHDGPDGGNGYYPTPGRLRVTNATLRQLIQMAYHVRTGTLTGATGWMDSDRFNIEAKASTKSNFDDDLVMLQALLTDRFQLRFHRETRQIGMQALVAVKGGAKIQRTADQDQKESVSIRPTSISGTAIPIGHFVSILEAQVGTPLLNETGLSGKYDLSLTYVRDDVRQVDGPTVFAALQDQLGLKLEARRGPAEVFIIDSAQRPSEN
jgi:uncharacterized protein (TIGR03435 family)